MQEHSFNSSNLEHGTYDESTSTLTITFISGATYEYAGVPEATWNELYSASSAGTYFSANIRNTYPATRIG